MASEKDFTSFLGSYFPAIEEWEKEKIIRWSEGIARKDPYYPDHVKNVCRYAKSLGGAFHLPSSAIELLVKGAFLHDIGKFSVPNSILAKPGPLTTEQRQQMHRYPAIGERLCQSLPSFKGAGFLVRSHHERLDGSGYPDGLQGDQIPVLLRLLAVADVFDALLSKRVYKSPFSPEAALSQLAAEVRMGLLDRTIVDRLTQLANGGQLILGQGDGEPVAQNTHSVHEEPVAVLVVDDNEDIRFITVTMLKAMGYQVYTAANGKEGLAVLREHRPIGIILLDIMMPEMDGFTFCKTVQADPGLEDIHIIIVSARGGAKDKIKGLHLGAADYLMKPFNLEELRARVGVGERIVRQQRALKGQRALLEKLVREDPLTGLSSRRFFEERLGEEWARAFRYHHPLSLVIGDLDNFKQINDRYGHPTGDRVLASVGELLRRDLRQSDIAARYGGDEFALLLPETEEEGALLTAERLRVKVKETNFTEAVTPFPVTTSFGIATARFPSPSSHQELQDWADRALYLAKNRGRDRVELFHPETQVKAGRSVEAIKAGGTGLIFVILSCLW
jgi:diguanylate cyclase (GGDEF)-like protein